MGNHLHQGNQLASGKYASESDERTYAELRYTAQSGINLIRLWVGYYESDYFFQLCDELGLWYGPSSG
jgi:beta-galactosidase/beta-glucuronidase